MQHAYRLIACWICSDALLICQKIVPSKPLRPQTAEPFRDTYRAIPSGYQLPQSPTDSNIIIKNFKMAFAILSPEFEDEGFKKQALEFRVSDFLQKMAALKYLMAFMLVLEVYYYVSGGEYKLSSFIVFSVFTCGFEMCTR